MLNPLESKISYLDRVKVQSEVLVPVLNCLRNELGQNRANELVYGALRDWSREVFEEAGSKKEVELTIEKTIMKGEEYCDFRFRFNRADGSDA